MLDLTESNPTQAGIPFPEDVVNGRREMVAAVATEKVQDLLGALRRDEGLDTQHDLVDHRGRGDDRAVTGVDSDEFGRGLLERVSGAVEPALSTAGGGLFLVDGATGETSMPGVFAGGDAVSGPALVVTAVAQAQRAARAMHDLMTGPCPADRTVQHA